MESGVQLASRALTANHRNQVRYPRPAVECVASPAENHNQLDGGLGEDDASFVFAHDLSFDDLNQLDELVRLADSSDDDMSPSPLPELLSPASAASCEESGYESVCSPSGSSSASFEQHVEEPILAKNINLAGPISDLFPDLV